MRYVFVVLCRGYVRAIYTTEQPAKAHSNRNIVPAQPEDVWAITCYQLRDE